METERMPSQRVVKSAFAQAMSRKRTKPEARIELEVIENRDHVFVVEEKAVRESRYFFDEWLRKFEDRTDSEIATAASTRLLARLEHGRRKQTRKAEIVAACEALDGACDILGPVFPAIVEIRKILIKALFQDDEVDSSDYTHLTLHCEGVHSVKKNLIETLAKCEEKIISCEKKQEEYTEVALQAKDALRASEAVFASKAQVSERLESQVEAQKNEIFQLERSVEDEKIAHLKTANTIQNGVRLATEKARTAFDQDREQWQLKKKAQSEELRIVQNNFVQSTKRLEEEHVKVQALAKKNDDIQAQLHKEQASHRALKLESDAIERQLKSEIEMQQKRVGELFEENLDLQNRLTGHTTIRGKKERDAQLQAADHLKKILSLEKQLEAVHADLRETDFQKELALKDVLQLQDAQDILSLQHNDADAGRAALLALNASNIMHIESLDLKLEFETKEAQRLRDNLAQKKEDELRALSELRIAKREQTQTAEELDFMKATHQSEIEEAELEAIACRNATVTMNASSFQEQLSQATAAARTAGIAFAHLFPTSSHLDAADIATDTFELLPSLTETAAQTINTASTPAAVQTEPLPKSQSSSLDTIPIRSVQEGFSSIQIDPKEDAFPQADKDQCSSELVQHRASPHSKIKSHTETKEVAVQAVICMNTPSENKDSRQCIDLADAACQASPQPEKSDQELILAVRRERERAQTIATLNSELQRSMHEKEKLIRKIEDGLREAQFEEQRASNGSETKVSKLIESIVTKMSSHSKASNTRASLAGVAQFQRHCQRVHAVWRKKNTGKLVEIHEGSVSSQVAAQTSEYVQQELMQATRARAAGVMLAQASVRDLADCGSEAAIAESRELEAYITEKQDELQDKNVRNLMLEDESLDLSAWPQQTQIDILKELLRRQTQRRDSDAQKLRDTVHTLRTSLNKAEERLNAERDKRIRDQIRRESMVAKNKSTTMASNQEYMQLKTEVSALVSLFDQEEKRNERPSTCSALDRKKRSAQDDSLTMLQRKIHEIKSSMMLEEGKAPLLPAALLSTTDTAYEEVKEKTLTSDFNCKLTRCPSSKEDLNLNEHIERCASRSRLTVLSRPPDFITNQTPLSVQIHRRSALRKLARMPITVVGRRKYLYSSP